MCPARSDVTVEKKVRIIGKTIAISLQVRDEFGNIATDEPGSVEVCLLCGEGSVQQPEYVGNGVYEASALPTRAGAFKVGVYIRGEHAVGSPFSVKVFSGAAALPAVAASEP